MDRKKRRESRLDESSWFDQNLYYRKLESIIAFKLARAFKSITLMPLLYALFVLLLAPCLSYHPLHVGIIVDGNGRWANERGWPLLEGHRVGAKKAVDVVQRLFERDADFITLFLFSSENWKRPQPEIDNIMFLLEKYLNDFSLYLKQNKIILKTIGDVKRLNPSILKLVNTVGFITSPGDDTNDDTRTLCLAVSYGGRDDIVSACKEITAAVMEGSIKIDDITTDAFSRFTQTGSQGIPDPDLIIRTSGEFRLSNFLLWQCAYSEFFSIKKYC